MSRFERDSNNNLVLVAGAYATDSALSDSSTNPVQNKVVKSALDGKAASSHTHTISQITDFPSIPAATSISWTGTASATDVRYQRIGIGSTYTEINGTKYMEQSLTTSTSTDTTYTFTNSAITTSSEIEVSTDQWGVYPSNVTVTVTNNVGTCTVTIPKQSTSSTLGVRIHIS